MRRFIAVLILLGIFALVVRGSLVPIPDGNLGVATSAFPDLKLVPTAPRALLPGVHLALPYMTRLQLYNTRVRMMSLHVPAGPGKFYDLTAQIHISSDSAVDLHVKLGPNYLDNAIRPTLQALLKDEIYEGASKSSGVSEERLRAEMTQMLSKNGMVLDEMILTLIGNAAANENGESETDEDTD